MKRLFVYGSLMQGQPNHTAMEDAQLVGAAATVVGFSLFDLGAYPAMAASPEGVVLGEVYLVSEAQQARLDRLEGHPRYYTRTPLQLEGAGPAEAYLMPSERVPLRRQIASGDWRSSRKERGL